MNGAEQLDLNVYEVIGVSWWQHPVVIALLIGLLVAIGVGILFLIRRLRQPREQFLPHTAAMQLLEDVRNRFETRQITGPQAVAAVTSLLKAYFAVFLQQSEIRAMTDQQWLVLLKTKGVNDDLYDDCQYIVQIGSSVKFNYAAVSLDEMARLLDCARRTIDRSKPVNK